MTVQYGSIHPLEALNARGKHTARVFYRIDGGERHPLTASGPNARAAAKALRAKMAGLTEANALPQAVAETPDAVTTMDSLWDAYAEHAEKMKRPKPQTVGYYEDAYLRHIKPVLGSRSVESITRGELFEWLHSSDARAPRWTYDALHALMIFARNSGRRQDDPTAGGLQIQRGEADPSPLSPDEIAWLESVFVKAAAAPTNRKSLGLAHMVMVGHGVGRDSGLRLGETLALRKRDFRPQTRQLDVRGTIVEIPYVTAEGKRSIKAIRQEEGKTDHAYRTVTLPEETQHGVSTMTLLRALWEMPGGPDSPLLPGRGAKFITPANFRRKWREEIEKETGTKWADLPEDQQFHYHQLRHTMATHLVSELTGQLGELPGLHEAARQLGHASVQPLRRYVSREMLPATDHSAVIATLNPAVADARRREAEAHERLRKGGFGHQQQSGHMVIWRWSGHETFDYAEILAALDALMPEWNTLPVTDPRVVLPDILSDTAFA